MMLLALSPFLILIPVGMVAGVVGLVIYARRKAYELAGEVAKDFSKRTGQTEEEIDDGEGERIR